MPQKYPTRFDIILSERVDFYALLCICTESGDETRPSAENEIPAASRYRKALRYILRQTKLPTDFVGDTALSIER